ncbi:MAG: DUF2723 domain-containing protein [bacterium]|nr:DUF2723 domain-containing protein [bacterium]
MSKRGYLYGFIIIFVIAFCVYLYTVEPSLSFWDCGEFIACGYSLGVPHPPGTPLYTLICRIFSLIPFGREIGFRVNMSSVITSAFVAVFIWLLIIKIIERAKKIDTNKDKVIAWLSGAVGAFIAAFSYTCWWDSVETEVYRLATLILLLCLFLILKWDENIKSKEHKKYLLIIAYLLTLSCGIQLIPLLAVPGILLFAFLKNREGLNDWDIFRFIALVIPFFVLSVGVPLPLVGVITICIIGFIIFSYRKAAFDGKFIGIVLFLLVIGFTTYAYLIIRARQNPGINEVAPTTINKLWDVFTRKQYGPDKVLAVFIRETATKENGYNFFQAFFEQIRFFTTYLIWQWMPYPREVRWEGAVVSNFTKIGSIAINTIFICLGLFGIYAHYKREKKTFLPLFITFFMVTIALVFYMNFKFSPSDPNPLHRPTEVRERHYFFDPAFALFGLYIGLGVWELLSRIRYGWQAIAPLFAIVAFVPIAGNFNSHVNRRGLWVADDYGYNMLMSCDDGATVFTNGDNDTFPLWFAQEVKHTKPTVKVANLSLLNTEWYIKQLKSWGVPISFTDYEIDNLMPLPMMKDGKPDRSRFLLVKDFGVRDIIATNGGYKFERKVFLPIKRETLPKEYRNRFPKNMEVIPPNYYARRLPSDYWVRLPEEYFLPPNEFANLVLKDYKPNSPVYFAVTCSRDNTAGFEPYLCMEGLVRRVTAGGAEFDIWKSDSLLNKVYRYRSIFDPKVYKDENIKKLLTNYSAAYFALGMAYKEKGRIDKAIEAFECGKRFKTGETLLPFAYQLAALYEVMGEHEKAESNLSEIPEESRGASVWYALGEFYIRNKDIKKAESSFMKAIESDSNDPSGYTGLIKLYYTQQDTYRLRKLFEKCALDPNLTGRIVSIFRFERENKLAALILENWLSYHPQDSIARGMLNELR